MIKQLEKSWGDLIDTSRVQGSAKAQILFEELLSIYTSPNRHYHNLNHIHMMLLLSERYSYSVPLLWAIWFHDAIYSTFRKDNEEKSAQLAQEKMTWLGISNDIIDETVRLILITKDHQSESINDVLGIQMSDLDLSILGSTPDRYETYTEQVRAEYHHIPRPVYKKARVSFIKSILNHTKLFQSREMSEFEANARKNLINELNNFQHD